jgi:hypothetical protein
MHTNIAVFRKYPFIQFSQLLQNPGLQIGVREVHHRKLHEKIKGVRLIRMQIVSAGIGAVPNLLCVGQLCLVTIREA